MLATRGGRVSGRAVELFAGPGGWSTGLRMVGVTDAIGVEYNKDAVATARAAGHYRIDHDQADVAAVDIAAFVAEHVDPQLRARGIDPDGLTIAEKVLLLIASPPCTLWSMAGRRNWGHARRPGRPGRDP
jgi:DNA (cytosine-5)-methyltransferase 1